MAVFIKSLQDNKPIFSKISVNGGVTSIDEVYQPPFSDMNPKVVGYCRGLFCLTYDNGKSLLWNPSIDEFLCLPLPDLKPPPCPSPNCAATAHHVDNTCTLRRCSGIRGLGFDPKSNDYKVVLLSSNFFDHYSSCELLCCRQAAIYSLTDRSWKEINPEAEKNYIVDDVGTYVDGQCYWLSERRDSFPSEVAVSLDFTSEKFSTVRLASGPAFRLGEHGFILTEFDLDSLAQIIYRVGMTKKNLLCWVRRTSGEKPEWVNESNFEFSAERPLGFCGDLMLFVGRDGKLMVYDPSSKELKRFDAIGDYPHQMSSFPYFESFVSFDNPIISQWPLKPHRAPKKPRSSEGGSKREGEEKGEGKAKKQKKRKGRKEQRTRGSKREGDAGKDEKEEEDKGKQKKQKKRKGREGDAGIC